MEQKATRRYQTDQQSRRKENYDFAALAISNTD